MPAHFNKSFLVFILSAVLPLAAHAHRAWLFPSSSRVDGKDPWVTVDAAISEDLFYPDTVGLKLDGLLIVGPDGAPVAPDNQFSGKLRNGFDLRLAEPGTYKISVVTDSVMASYKLNGEMKRWRGTEETLRTEIPPNAEDLKVMRMHARQETFVSAGTLNTKAFVLTGKGLELDPVSHPDDLRAGEKASLRLLLNGKPAANLPFSLVPGGVRYRGVLGEIRLSTDDQGEATFVLPDAGMYWLSATYPLRGAPDSGKESSRPELPAQRYSYAATLEILPQ